MQLLKLKTFLFFGWKVGQLHLIGRGSTNGKPERNNVPDGSLSLKKNNEQVISSPVLVKFKHLGTL